MASARFRRNSEPRKSVALYYYTSVENETYSGDTITYWQTHEGKDMSRVELAELRVSKGLTRMARSFYRLGHRINPIHRRAGKAGTSKVE